MLEKLNLSLKKSIQIKKLNNIAGKILGDKSCDYFDKHNHQIAVRRLTEVLNTYLNLDCYERLTHKEQVISLIREKFLASGLMHRKTYGRTSSDSDSYYNEYAVTFFSKNATILSYPCVSIPHNIATDAIRMTIIHTLKKHYPKLLNNKTALTLLCIRQFHPQSFFAKMPKDIIKVILKHAENSDKAQHSKLSIQCRR